MVAWLCCSGVVWLFGLLLYCWQFDAGLILLELFIFVVRCGLWFTLAVVLLWVWDLLLCLPVVLFGLVVVDLDAVVCDW